MARPALRVRAGVFLAPQGAPQAWPGRTGGLRSCRWGAAGLYCTCHTVLADGVRARRVPYLVLYFVLYLWYLSWARHWWMPSGTRWSTCPGFRRLRTVHELGNWQCPHSTLTSCRLSRHSRLRPSHPSTKSGYRELVWPLHGGRPSRRPNSGSLASPRRPLPPPSHPQDASSPKSKTRTQHLHTGTWPAKPNQTPPSYLGSRYSTLPSRPRHSSIHLPPILQLPDRYRVLAGRSRCQTRIGSTATLNSNDVGRPAGIVDSRDAPPQHQPFVRRAVRDALVLCRVVSSRNRRSVPPHQRCPVLCRPPRRLSSWSGHQQGSRHSHRQERRRVSWNAGSSVESRRERGVIGLATIRGLGAQPPPAAVVHTLKRTAHQPVEKRPSHRPHTCSQPPLRAHHTPTRSAAEAVNRTHSHSHSHASTTNTTNTTTTNSHIRAALQSQDCRLSNYPPTQHTRTRQNGPEHRLASSSDARSNCRIRS